MAVADGGGKSEAVNQGVALAPHLEQQEVGVIDIEGSHCSLKQFGKGPNLLPRVGGDSSLYSWGGKQLHLEAVA